MAEEQLSGAPPATPTAVVADGSGRIVAPTIAARLGLVGGLVLGGVLLIAATLKALDLDAFAEEVARQRIAFGLPARWVALFALALEAGLGTALLLNLRRRPLLIVSTLVVALFLFLTGRGAWRAAHGWVDEAGSCGCFGSLVERTPLEAFVQDLFWLVPALGFAWLGRPGSARAVSWRWGAVAAVTLATTAFALQAANLPLDDVATRLRPGVELAELCAGADAARICLSHLAPALGSGKHLVVLADVRAPGFEILARRLNAYQRAGGEPPVVVLADFTDEERQALFWSVAPAFDLQEAPRALLRPLYRRLPRTFLVDQGRVAATWAGVAESIPELAADR